MAALDCLTGEADSALKNLKVAIDLRAENRYHARNDEDFAFLQEDPRFTELLYPEKDGTAGESFFEPDFVACAVTHPSSARSSLFVRLISSMLGACLWLCAGEDTVPFFSVQ